MYELNYMIFLFKLLTQVNIWRKHLSSETYKKTCFHIFNCDKNTALENPQNSARHPKKWQIEVPTSYFKMAAGRMTNIFIENKFKCHQHLGNYF